jgi:hypothetical protein
VFLGGGNNDHRARKKGGLWFAGRGQRHLGFGEVEFYAQFCQCSPELLMKRSISKFIIFFV